MSKLYKFLIIGIIVVVSVVGLVAGCKNREEQNLGQSNLASENQIEGMFAEGEKGGGGTKVIAYYFYTNFRCQSCYAIEKYTKEAIEGSFEDELTSGKLIFKTVNIEEKDNEHFLGDYQLYTKSVVLSLLKDGKEIKFKNLKEVWELLRNKDEFYKYIKEETKGFLDEINQEKEQ